MVVACDADVEAAVRVTNDSDKAVECAPPEPPLDLTYDVCIVGSGAGGSVVAALVAEAGKSVLIVEEGDWISPHEYPTRDDMALRKMFRQAGVYPALDPDITDVVADVLCNGLPTVLNVLQARVVGGGPTVNNAIMLPIPQRIWTEWRNRHQFPIEWQALSDSMDAGLRRDPLGRHPGLAAPTRAGARRRRSIDCRAAKGRQPFRR